MKYISKTFLLIIMVLLIWAGAVQAQILINEVDADIAGTEVDEFIELYDGGIGNTPLDNLVLVLFNGSDDQSYTPVFDLDGYTTDANGYFVIGGTGVANADIIVTNSYWLQNGADAVALYAGNASDFPNDTPVTTVNLIDAIVYDTNDSDDTGLLVLLNAGQPQVNEDGNGDKDNHSNQRCPNGSGVARNTNTYTQFNPTPNADNCTTPDDPPTISSTTPANGATNVPVDTNIDIAFSEDVTVTGDWFTIACTVSGSHTAVVSGGPQNYTLDPATDFSNDETCTVTIVAIQVTDQDGTPDSMTADYVWSFTTTTGVPSSIIINEILADPASGLAGDANGDGTRDYSDDEFVELVNTSDNDVDISGWTLSDAFTVRHTFPAGTIIPAHCAIVVFGGGTPTGTFGGVIVQTASGGSLGLTNGGDTVTLNDGVADQDTMTYSSEGGDDQSLTRDPDITGSFMKHSTATGSGGALFSPGTMIDGSSFSGCAQPVAQLLLTEVVVTPTEGEYIEIYNPNASVVDLSDVYLTDATFAGGGIFYYNIVTGSNAGGDWFGDFHARFPAGATINPGEYQTIALNGSGDFFTEYGINPTYELYEDDSTPDAIPDMQEALPGSISAQGGLSNGAEVVILYHWDGQSDLVTDLDYVVWGDKDEAVDKSGVAIDGPDADTNTNTYYNDTAISAQEPVASSQHAYGNSWQREDLTEGTETKTGGNGAGGHDETSENLGTTWCENTPNPGQESDCSAPPVEMCGDPYTPIYIIQGFGGTSPSVGHTVSVEGIITADFQGANELDGFFVQDPQGDGDASTSDGIFVFAPGSVDVSVDQAVRVSGTVIEYNGLTQIGGNPSILDCGTGNVAPTSVELPVPPVPPLPPAPAGEDLEPYEGMLVTFPEDLTASQNYFQGRYGQVTLSADGRLYQPTNQHLPGSPEAIALADENLRRMLVLDDGQDVSQWGDNPNPIPYIGADNTLRAGDTVAGLTGVLDYGLITTPSNPIYHYRLHPTETVSFTRMNDRTMAPEDVEGTLKVASFNVLNYFTTIDTGAPICGPNADQDCRGADSQEEFIRQRDKIISAIVAMDADVIGLMELENHPAEEALQDLVTGLNAAGPETYALINTGPIGTDVIKVAFIYKPDTVTPVGSYAILDGSVDPTFNDQRNRPVLAQTFEQNGTGEKFTTAVNHLKSKGTPCTDPAIDDPLDPDTGDGQGNCNLTRTSAAIALTNWLAGDPTSSGDSDFLIIGDLNSYAMEDPITTIKNAGYTNLIEMFGGTDAYSYIFNGQAGYLDHALANSTLTAQVTGVTEWHINTDEPSVIDYNTEYKPQDLYTPTPYRASDHDPVIVGLDLRRIKDIVGTDRIGDTPIFDVFVGDIFTYTLDLKNPFEQAVYFVISDTLDAALEYSGGPFTETPNGLEYTSELLGINETLSLSFNVQVQDVPVGTIIDNTAWITVLDIAGATLAAFEAIAPSVHVIPEPATLLLVGAGVVGILAFARRRRRQKK